MTTLHLILLCSNALFLFLWLWSSFLLARSTRAQKIALNSSAALTDVIHTYELVKTMLEQNKMNAEVLGELTEDLSTLNMRMDAYNHRLNDLTGAVRTKVNRIDNSGVKM